MTALFAPACSIAITKRRRFFWAAWWTAPPSRVPFQRPDASDGGAATRDEALAAAERAAGVALVSIDPLWARAWLRVIRGDVPWPSAASREPRGTASRSPGSARASGSADGAPSTAPTDEAVSIWTVLGVTREATEEELKAAFRRRALETHPDHGGSEAAFRRVMRAYQEARRRTRRPKRG